MSMIELSMPVRYKEKVQAKVEKMTTGYVQNTAEELKHIQHRRDATMHQAELFRTRLQEELDNKSQAEGNLSKLQKTMQEKENKISLLKAQMDKFQAEATDDKVKINRLQEEVYCREQLMKLAQE